MVDVIVMRLPAVPVTVKVPAKLYSGTFAVCCLNVTVFAAPIPVTEKLLKLVVFDPPMSACAVVLKATVPELCVNVPLFVKSFAIVKVPEEEVRFTSLFIIKLPTLTFAAKAKLRGTPAAEIERVSDTEVTAQVIVLPAVAKLKSS